MRDDAGLQLTTSASTATSLVSCGEQICRGDPQEERERSAGAGKRGSSPGREREEHLERPSHGGPNPAAASFAWPFGRQALARRRRGRRRGAARPWRPRSRISLPPGPRREARSAVTLSATGFTSVDVDEACVRLAQRDLPDHALDVVLLAHDLVEDVACAHVLEHRARVVADRDPLCADDELDVLALQVVDRLDPGRVAFGTIRTSRLVAKTSGLSTSPSA